MFLLNLLKNAESNAEVCIITLPDLHITSMLEQCCCPPTFSCCPYTCLQLFQARQTPPYC